MGGRIILINKDQNPKGRMLVQDDQEYLFVLSACCEDELDGLSGKCAGCGEVEEDLGDKGPSYRTTFKATAWGVNNSRAAWSGWIEYWFGLKEGMIEYVGS